MNFLRPTEEIRLLEISKPLHDQVVIQAPLMSGIGPGELADLQVEDVLWDYSVIAVWRSKISNDHLAIVDPNTLFLLWQYVDKRKTGHLLRVEGTRRMKAQHLRRTVKKWAKEVKLARWHRVTPYTLRHTFCIKWVLGLPLGQRYLEPGFRGSLEGLRRQLGLKSLQKLKHYLDYDYSDVREEYARIFGDITGLTRRHWSLLQRAPYIV